MTDRTWVVTPMIDGPQPTQFARSEMAEHIMQFFEYGHLPLRLQEVSKPFGQMAQGIVAGVPRNPERTVALRKLLESKDACVRAVLAGADAGPSGLDDPAGTRPSESFGMTGGGA